ncbi:prepilin peptidase [Gardnerella greenwoodii]|uniref:prepilin peptidase n=1 Tax=Gardnerella greenwoodii TaxID=2914925 RepID=UPI00037DE49D|nr:prepilin peptidase [Gardnerella greenwoodii]
MKQLIITIISALPTLACLISVCATDIKSRVVPRLWVVVALIFQSFANLIYSIILFENISVLIFGWLSCVIIFAIYWIIRKISAKNAIGFGDITSAAMIAQALVLFGFDSLIYWFALVGVVGLLWLLVWKIYCKIRIPTNASIPFVPVEAISAILAALLSITTHSILGG